MKHIRFLLLILIPISLAKGQAVIVDQTTRKVDLKGTYSAAHRETIEVYLNELNSRINDLNARLKKLEPAPVVTTPPSSTTAAPVPTPAPTPAPVMAAGPSGYYADSTKLRIDESVMNDVFINSEAELRNAGQSDFKDKRLITTFPVFTGELEIAGNWDNVYLKTQTRYSTKLFRSDWSTVLITNQRKPKRRIKIEGFVFESTFKGWGNPLVWSTELVGFQGIEWAYCKFVGPGEGDYNALGMVQYSTASNSGEVSESVFIHHCQFLNIPRMDIELLSQGQDKIRIRNIVITNNLFHNDGPNRAQQHRMATSIAGSIENLYEANNKSNEAKDIAYEVVHVQGFLLRNNDAVAKLETCSAYSITDDWGGFTTKRGRIEGGRIDVTGRPFQIYNSRQIQVDAKGNLWKSHRGVQMNAQDSKFSNLNLLVHSTTHEAAFEFDGASVRDTLESSTINTIGSIQAGYIEPFESVATRQNTVDILIKDVTGMIGKMPNGSFHFDSGINVEKGTRIRVVNFKVVKEQ